MSVEEAGKPTDRIVKVFKRINDIEMSGGFVGYLERLTIGA